MPLKWYNKLRQDISPATHYNLEDASLPRGVHSKQAPGYYDCTITYVRLTLTYRPRTGDLVLLRGWLPPAPGWIHQGHYKLTSNVLSQYEGVPILVRYSSNNGVYSLIRGTMDQSTERKIYLDWDPGTRTWAASVNVRRL